MTNVPFINSITNELSKRKLKSAVVANAILDIAVGNDRLDDLIANGVTQSDLESLTIGGLTTEQTAAIEKIEGLQASASEIDASVSASVNVLDYGAKYYQIDPLNDLADAINLIKAKYPDGIGIMIPSYQTFLLRSGIVLDKSKYPLYSPFGEAKILIDESINQPDWFIKTGGDIKNIKFEGLLNTVGNGVLFENTENEYNFIGNVKWENVTFRKLRNACNMGNMYSCLFIKVVAEYCKRGFLLNPKYSSSFDSGYTTASLWIQCAFRFNSDYGIDTLSELGIRQTAFYHVSIEGNRGVVSGFQSRFNYGYSTFNTIYLEGVSTIPAMVFGDHNANIHDLYMNGTGGIKINETSSDITIAKMKTTSITDKIDYIPSAITTLSISDSRLISELNFGGKNLFIKNSTIGSKGFISLYSSSLSIGNTDTAIKSVRGFTFTSSTTILANSSKRIKGDIYTPSLNSESVITAYLSSKYYEGLQLYVNRASSGNDNYSSVIAVNSTSSDIILNNDRINIIMQTLSSYKPV